MRPSDTTSAPSDLPERSLESRSVSNDLFSFFVTKDDGNIVKSWVDEFNANPLNAFCDLLSLILQIAGKRIEVTAVHIEGDLFDQILEEFQDAMDNDPKFDGALLERLMKDKGNKLVSFWRQISEAIISCNALFSEHYNTFRQWIVVFNCCKIGALRMCSTYCAFELLRALANALERTDKEISRLSSLPENDTIKEQMEVFQREKRLYLAVVNHLFQNSVVIRTRDVEPELRCMSVSLITDVAMVYPEYFVDIQKLNYIGRATFDLTPKNRRDALRCFEQIIHKLAKEDCTELVERYIQHIIELCDDKDNAVVSSALDCLLALSEKQMIDNVDCSHAYELLCDDSQAIRTSAVKFVFQHYFSSSSDIKTFLKFCSNFESDDIPNIVASLFPKLKCLRQWEEICKLIMTEECEKDVYLLAQILLTSAQRTVGKLIKIAPESEKKIRKLTTILVKCLPNLIRAFQAESETVVLFIEAASLLDLNTISDCSNEHLYQQLLGEIRDLFLNSNNRTIFTAAISTLYELSIGKHQLSTYAKQELDRLAVECGKIEDIENECTISKFVSAARLVDVSDDGKLRSVILRQIDQSTNDRYIADCIECLHFFFKWDIKRICDHPDEKQSYIPIFHDYLETFSKHLQSGPMKVKEESFKALSSVFCLSLFLRDGDSDDALVPAPHIDSFYRAFHLFFDKLSLFDYARKPIELHSIPLSYSAHLIVYYGVDSVQPDVKSLWRELSPYKPIDGSQLLISLTHSNLSDKEMKSAARFIVGKYDVSSAVSDWFRSGEDDRYLIPILTFLFSLTPSSASSLSSLSSSRFSEFFAHLSSSEKPSPRLYTALLSTRRLSQPPPSDEPAESFISQN